MIAQHPSYESSSGERANSSQDLGRGAWRPGRLVLATTLLARHVFVGGPVSVLEAMPSRYPSWQECLS